MRTTALVAFLSICVSVAAFGQTATETTATTVTATTTTATTGSKTTTAKEIDRNEPPDAPATFDMHDNSPASMSYVHSYNRADWKLAGLDDKISIHVNNFSTLVAKANNDCAQIVLFLDGMPIKGLKPESCDRIAGHIRYRLLRTNDADNAWHSLLGSPQGFTRIVNVTVGPDTQNTIANQMEFKLQVLPRKQFWMFVLLLAVMLAIFVMLCRRTALIRGGSPEVPPAQRPYSLSLFQMSFWFFLVIAAYVFLWLINDELDTITESVLALIGIGAATALSATLIDQNKPTPVSTDKSAGFLRDVMSDPAGISLHRFQMFAWTLILGVIFVGSVYHNLEMPQFSATLLGLMGISSGTYLGFKVPEKASTDAPAGTQPEAGNSSS
ncbi:MAG TPA: hypothetical protein VJZ76_17965 [Thermoanaerobaculia bacterium]|nr:hypothetical protein [Thermoanaerobaculia bacterium]